MDTAGTLGVWMAFVAFVLAMLALDLGVFHRRPHVVGLREALAWSGVWIALGLLFGLGIYFWRGPQATLSFLTGYLVEKSLSVDNIFVFLLIFSYFKVPPLYQHKVLFWGILGALLMRAVLIGAGVALIQRFHWIAYVFGALLIVAGVKTALHRERQVHPGKNPLLRLLRRCLPMSEHYDGGRFFHKPGGRYVATPLLAVLLVIETTDLVFAVDSIPAILAITVDPFIVYSSNVFAILGLRALYFALAGVMRLFHYLHYGLSAILVFVGAKMLLADVYRIPVGAALGVIAGILLVSLAASLLQRGAGGHAHNLGGRQSADRAAESAGGQPACRERDPEITRMPATKAETAIRY